jgi:hypothetical protein
VKRDTIEIEKPVENRSFLKIQKAHLDHHVLVIKATPWLSFDVYYLYGVDAFIWQAAIEVDISQSQPNRGTLGRKFDPRAVRWLGN